MDQVPQQNLDARLTVRIPEASKAWLEKIAQESEISISKALTNVLADKRTKHHQPSADYFSKAVEGNYDDFIKTIKNLDKSLTKVSLQASETIQINTKSLVNAVENTELTIRNGAKEWSDLINSVESIREFFAEIEHLTGKFNQQKMKFDDDLVWFKRQLQSETKAYKKKLDAFAIKHYLFASIFLGLSTLGVIVALKYFL